MNLSTFIKISRPRFWLYSAGTFWVGAIAGATYLSDLYDFRLLLFLAYFLLPANLFIYGVNDLADGDTDQYNDKKNVQEHLLKQTERRFLILTVVLSLLLGFVVIYFSPNLLTQQLIFIFLFLAFWYSVPPLRFKAKPIVDALSNIHYAVIGFASYAYFTNHLPPWWSIIAALLWTAAMQIYSAIPDIQSDKQAKLYTTAIWLGEKYSMYICLIFWLTCSILLYINFSTLLSLLSLLYPVYIIWQLVKKIPIKQVYWFYPYINAIMGFVLFWYLVFQKI